MVLVYSVKELAMQDEAMVKCEEYIKAWYRDRIEKRELNLSGWSRGFSQKLRWEANLRMIYSLLPPDQADKFNGGFSVIDFGCGRALFFDYIIHHSTRIMSYVGIEMREDAFASAKQEMGRYSRVRILSSLDELSKLDPPIGMVDVCVANGVYGFHDQRPLEDMRRIQELVNPKVFVLDFFSALADWGEKDNAPGYVNVLPFAACRDLMNALGMDRFILDHSSAPHFFSVGLSRVASPWAAEEERNKQIGGRYGIV